MTRHVAAPDEWRTIDFISDLHLSAATPNTTRAWRDHLVSTSADAVYMLGDLFELWVGDDAVSQPFEASCAAILREVAHQRHLGFMAGNRDFLLGEKMAAASGMHRLEEPVCLHAFGQRVLICHGDALCVADVEYQRFRSVVRSAPWQREFLGRPLDERLALAAEMRRASEARKRFDGAEWVDVDTTLAHQWLDEAGASVLVHGHTHRPATHDLGADRSRHVLSDWDLDGTSPRAEVLRWTAAGFVRIPPTPVRA